MGIQTPVSQKVFWHDRVGLVLSRANLSTLSQVPLSTEVGIALLSFRALLLSQLSLRVFSYGLAILDRVYPVDIVLDLTEANLLTLLAVVCLTNIYFSISSNRIRDIEDSALT